MAKFSRKGKGGLPQVSTASLPDIVFMLLFFFMVSTVMRDSSLKVKFSAPGATEVAKLERKSLVSYVYIGEPLPGFQSFYGTEPRIQLNDAFATVSDIRDYVITEREKRDENERPFMTTSLRIDKNTQMGIVQDVKMELRKASALRVNYSTRKVTDIFRD